MNTYLLGAVIVGQYGALVRTSARLVGKRPSLSIKERAVRFLSIINYGTLLLLGLGAGAAPVITAIAFGGFGLKEAVRVGYEMRSRRVESIVTVVKATNGESEAYVVDQTACTPGGIY